MRRSPTYRLCHPANFSVCYSPWILWAWTGLATAATPRRQAGWLAALVATNWLVFTSGTVKEAYMAMVCLNFAGALLLLTLPDARAFRWRVLGLATLAGGGVVLLTAPGWMSFLDALHHSYTGYDTPVAHPLPFAQFIGFFDDIFYRQATVDELVVAPALNFFLLLGVAWWLVSPRLWRSDFAGRALLVAAVPPLLLAFGVVFPHGAQRCFQISTVLGRRVQLRLQRRDLFLDMIWMSLCSRRFRKRSAFSRLEKCSVLLASLQQLSCCGMGRSAGKNGYMFS